MSDSDSNEVRDYLLGKLPGEAAERFEERLFADDEVLRSAGEQQDALIDEFLSGDLNAQDEAVFRAQVERSTTLQNRVETHRTLLRALERRAEGSHRGTFSTEHGWVWLLAACLVVAAVAAGVLRQQAKSAQTELALSSQPSSLVRPASPPSRSGFHLLSVGQRHARVECAAAVEDSVDRQAGGDTDRAPRKRRVRSALEACRSGWTRTGPIKRVRDKARR